MCGGCRCEEHCGKSRGDEHQLAVMSHIVLPPRNACEPGGEAQVRDIYSWRALSIDALTEDGRQSFDTARPRTVSCRQVISSTTLRRAWSDAILSACPRLAASCLPSPPGSIFALPRLQPSPCSCSPPTSSIPAAPRRHGRGCGSRKPADGVDSRPRREREGNCRAGHVRDSADSQARYRSRLSVLLGATAHDY